MKTCFGYVRVSTQKQGEGVSLEAQREAIEHFASRNDITISQWFEEKVTAAKTGRPLFNSMITQLRRRKAQGVVMHKIDRSARNFADWARIGDLSDAGIDVHFASESLDFRSRGGRLAADIQAVIAADYIRNLRDECLKGMRGRLKQGLFPWAAPLGYLNNGKGKPKTLDPIRAPLVRQLFELYAGGGHSFLSLRDEMQRRGLRNVRDGVITTSGIEAILRNPFYCGIVRVRTTGEAYKGCHEPLISASLYEDIQGRKIAKAGKKVTRHNHLFAGLFRCALCGVAMTAERQKGHVYYRCHTLGCATGSVREEVINDLVRQELRAAILTGEQKTRLRDAVAEWCAAGSEDTELTTTDLQLKQIDARQRRLTDLLIDGTIKNADYLAKEAEFALERA
ncbi:MAG: recombinase family protein, partial [Devosia sp.]